MDTKKLRLKILDLAIHGKLVPQDPNDEPASDLLKRLGISTDNCPCEDLPFELPEGWCWTILKDVSYQIGTRENQILSKDVQQKGLIPVVSQSAQIIDGYCDEINRKVSDIPVILFGDHTRVVKFIDFEFVVGADGTKLLKSRIDEKYLYYWVKVAAVSIRNRGYARHFALLKQIPIPLPPLAEQKRIVSAVEQWMSVIDVLENNEEDLRQSIDKAKSKILDLAIRGKLVPQDSNDEPASNLLKRLGISPDYSPCDDLPNGWTAAYLSELCTNINGLWKGKKEPFVNIGIIRNANFTKDFKLDYSNIEYLDVEKKSFSKRSLNNGDLIVEKSGGSDKNPVGRAVLYEGEDGKYSFSNFTMALRVRNFNVISSKYLYYFILNMYKLGAMSSMQTQTTGLHNLILDKYLAIEVSLPPLAEQHRIVAKIEQLYSQLDEIESSLQS